MNLRLRQLCLVAQQLDPVVDELCAIFGVEVCHRDPAVAAFGLRNALMPFGTSFVEVVAPVAEGTAAARYLQRRGGDGGYMVILDTGSLGPWREHVASVGVRIAADLANGDYAGLQLHPRDTGGALLEINTTRGGDDLQGPYGPAGPYWQSAVRTQCVTAVVGAALQSDDPQGLAQRWGRILQRPPVLRGPGAELALDNAVLRFVRNEDGRGEGLAAIDLQVRDVPAVLARAALRSHRTGADSVDVGGARFTLRA
jgi:hypothetical protein